MIKILFICHGNICRSPMAEYILKDMAQKRGLKDLLEIASAATSTEEIWNGKGNPVYPPAQKELLKHGIGKTGYTDFTGKRARQVTKEDYGYYDYLLCADGNNIRNTIMITGPDKDNKIRLLMDFAGKTGRSIADPWYTGRFDETYKDVVEGCEGLFMRKNYTGIMGAGSNKPVPECLCRCRFIRHVTAEGDIIRQRFLPDILASLADCR